MSTEAKVPMRRIAVASCVGTTIEFYDFFIYGTAAALVFPKVFFPALGPAAAAVASFATFAVAFVARPVGAVLFGHFGDRVGRKRTLISTLLLMGVATTLIGLLPGASTIGVAAPVVLVVLRLAQGLAVGGEWAGAALLTAEYAPGGSRGRYATCPQLGAFLAFGLSSVTFLATGLLMGDKDAAFLDYGWRVPFVVSSLLVVVGLYVRLRIEETPVFRRAQEQVAAGSAREHSRPPFREAILRQPREVLLAAGSLTIVFSFFNMGTTYLTSYGVSPDGAGQSRPTVLVAGIIAAVVSGVVTVVTGALSDRLGRKRLIMAAGIAGAVWGLLLFPLLDTRSTLAFGFGLVVTLVIVGVCYAPTGAFLPELFETRYRYTGAGLSYNLAGVVGGAVPPLLAPALTASYGSIAIGVLLSVSAVLSFFCTRALVETKDRTLTIEPAERELAPTG
ncbi:MFS transporter [Actinophytocola sp.]|uniref:MFS transporter n=1 Tax=Actinophytocola sp. TaxID=1872138 RepID=UPI003899B63E